MTACVKRVITNLPPISHYTPDRRDQETTRMELTRQPYPQSSEYTFSPLFSPELPPLLA